MTDSKNILGVIDWTDNTDELEQQLEAVKDKLQFSRTMAEREQVLQLEKELLADRELLKELRSKSDELAVQNKPIVVELESRVKALKEESWDSFMDAQELERAIQIKNQELNRLRSVIKQTV
jgi:DNA repair exonuclease SbcCD ATPase subunit